MNKLIAKSNKGTDRILLGCHCGGCGFSEFLRNGGTKTSPTTYYLDFYKWANGGKFKYETQVQIEERNLQDIIINSKNKTPTFMGGTSKYSGMYYFSWAEDTLVISFYKTIKDVLKNKKALFEIIVEKEEAKEFLKSLEDFIAGNLGKEYVEKLTKKMKEGEKNGRTNS